LLRVIEHHPYCSFLQLFGIPLSCVHDSILSKDGASRKPGAIHTIAYLSWRFDDSVDFIRVWDKQEISEGLKEVVDIWCPAIFDKIIKSAGERNVTEWCKKKECWDGIKAMRLDVPDSLKNEFREKAKAENIDDASNNQQIDFEDMEIISRVMKLDGDTWLRIHAWGIETRELQKWQSGIALTLSGYAAASWARKPSVKQARQAIKILEIVSAHIDIDY
ncbi:MAG: hypothetical protein M1455_11500, partial [Actinobacteria bacterium]|nr:hypothetical protein [Actinomycetota bacterium]